jgi:nucleoside 2-deoxyribosyltransferase
VLKVIYIAGKYRGPNPWAVEQNIRAAEEVAARVWAMGMVALCPHANSRHMEGVASDEHFLAGTLELLRRCDAVVVCPGWRDSRGTMAEVAEAHRLGIPVFGKSADGDGKHHVDFSVAVRVTMKDLARWGEAQQEALR